MVGRVRRSCDLSALAGDWTTSDALFQGPPLDRLKLSGQAHLLFLSKDFYALVDYRSEVRLKIRAEPFAQVRFRDQVRKCYLRLRGLCGQLEGDAKVLLPMRRSRVRDAPAGLIGWGNPALLGCAFSELMNNTRNRRAHSGIG